MNAIKKELFEKIKKIKKKIKLTEKIEKRILLQQKLNSYLSSLLELYKLQEK